MKSLLVEPTKNNISQSADKNKPKILNYLKNGRVIGVVPGIMKDSFTLKQINGQWLLMTDGIYEWDTKLIYYYEKYNIVLPQEFIRSIGF